MLENSRSAPEHAFERGHHAPVLLLKPDADADVAWQPIAVHRANNYPPLQELFVNRTPLAHLDQDEVGLARHKRQAEPAEPALQVGHSFSVDLERSPHMLVVVHPGFHRDQAERRDVEWLAYVV